MRSSFCVGRRSAEWLESSVRKRYDPGWTLSHVKAENELALAYAGYGRLLKQQRRPAEARDYLTRALAIFEHLGTLIEPDNVRTELAQLTAA